MSGRGQAGTNGTLRTKEGQTRPGNRKKKKKKVFVDVTEALRVRSPCVGVALNPVASVLTGDTAESQEEEERLCEDRAGMGGTPARPRDTWARRSWERRGGASPEPPAGARPCRGAPGPRARPRAAWHLLSPRHQSRSGARWAWTGARGVGRTDTEDLGDVVTKEIISQEELPATRVLNNL